MLLKQLFKFFKLLNSDTGSRQIAAGIALGIILGFSPVISIQSLLVIIIIVIFKVQIGAAFVAAFFSKFLVIILNPVFHFLGSIVLENQPLQPLFRHLYNLPLLPLTRFYNSLVMGAGVLGILIAPVSFFVSLYLIENYRHYIVAKFEKTYFWKFWKTTKFYQWYRTYDKLFG